MYCVHTCFGPSVRASGPDQGPKLFGLVRSGPMYRPVKMKVAEKGRNSSTIKTNCQFRIAGQKLYNGQRKLNLNNLVHNHERPQSLAGLANARRDSNMQRDDISDLVWPT
jgi:hypothetical protein